ncbi:MAG: glycerate kinase [Chloroflexota bacterium]|nr:glycerate kinase [Chloroflexota bacterium]
MKIVISPQTFKGTISAPEAARAIASGVHQVFPLAELARVPVADGGDGTLDVLLDATAGKVFYAIVSGPLGNPVVARWGVLGDGRTAIIEAAQACGLALLPQRDRNPLKTTTLGVGELIKQALDNGYRRIIIGLGGTSTNDGGSGLASALGVSFLNANGVEIGLGGGNLNDLASIDESGLDPRVKETVFIAASDVTNPLCGPIGAAITFGPQKGATPKQAKELDVGLSHFADVMQHDVGIDVATVAGGGAAGGMGGGVYGFLKAKIDWGADIVCDVVEIERHLEGASLVITGEGQLDWQTAYNKAPVVVAHHAGARSIPVLGVAGTLGRGWKRLYAEGFTSMRSIVSGPVSLNEAFHLPKQSLIRATVRGLQSMKRRYPNYF